MEMTPTTFLVFAAPADGGRCESVIRFMHSSTCAPAIHRDDRAGHDLAYLGVFGVVASQDALARIVALRRGCRPGGAR